MSEFSSNTTASRAVLKDRAKGALEGHYGTAVLIFFLVFVIEWVANMLVSGANSMLIFIADVFTGILKTGFCLFCLNLCCGRIAQASDLFYGYRCQFGKSLLLSFTNVLITMFYLLPANLAASAWSSGADTVGLYLVLTVVGAVLSVYLSLHLEMSWYLLLDFPDRSAAELLRLSARVVRGHKRRLFLLDLSFLPLELLNLFTLGIGSLWIGPYIRMTYTTFFLDLMKKD